MPVGHATQDEARSTRLVWLPGGQSTQDEGEVLPTRALYLPLAHGVQTDVFAELLYVPTGHGVHAALVLPGELLKVPDGQTRHPKPFNMISLPAAQ